MQKQLNWSKFLDTKRYISRLQLLNVLNLTSDFLQKQPQVVVSVLRAHLRQAKTKGMCELVNPLPKEYELFPPQSSNWKKTQLPYLLLQKQRERAQCFARQNRKCCFSTPPHRRELKPTIQTPLPRRWNSELVAESWEIRRIKRI